MSDYTPTTEEIRDEYALGSFRCECEDCRRPRAERFDRWLASVKAEAWDAGFAAGVNTDMGDYEHPPEIRANPYRNGDTK